MGAYSPAPIVTDEIFQDVMDSVIRPTVDGMAAEGNAYCGQTIGFNHNRHTFFLNIFYCWLYFGKNTIKSGWNIISIKKVFTKCF
jgi:hypothetical protein